MLEGFLLIDKPRGWTSHDVVAKSRGLLGIKKVGHAGTLDPMATGLLVLGIGRATRLLRFVQEGVKVYEARVAFGIATDTLDADGAILEREPMEFEEGDLVRVAGGFIGRVAQVPPMVSAVKVGGRRLYELAREGIEIDRPERIVEINSIDVVDFAPGPYPEATIEVSCGAGTYVRTLADDLARALGGRAHLLDLRRTRIGPHRVGDAVPVDSARLASEPTSFIIDSASGLSDIPAVSAGPAEAPGVGNGVVFAAGALSATEPGLYRIVDEAGSLLAVYSSDGRKARPEVVLA